MAESKEGETYASVDARETYKLYRERIVNEDALIYHRLSWLIGTQAVMFSFTATASFKSGAERLNTEGALLMCILGILICLVSYGGIVAALQIIEEIGREYDKKHADPGRLLPTLVGQSWRHRLGRLVPFLIPPMFVIAWLTILVIRLH